MTLMLLLSSCSGGGTAGRFAGRGNPANAATSVEVTTVKPGSISRQVVTYGTIKSSDIVNVTPQVSNRVIRIYAYIGDTVKDGQLLAKIYDQPYRDQLAQDAAQLAQAQANLYRDSLQYIRQRTLYQRNLVSGTDFESTRATYLSSKAQYKAAEAAYQQSRQNLNYTEVRSPVYGVVTQRNVAAGNVVTQNDVLYQINNLLGLESDLYLPRPDWQQVKVGQKVSFYISENDDKVAEGTVTRKSPQLDPATGLGTVVVSLNEAGNDISPGLLCRTVIDVETHNNAVIIPRDALVENVQTFIDPESNTIQLQQTYSAFIVKNDTLALRKDVKTGIREGNEVEILSGISAGDQLIVTGQNGLQDSAKVRIVHPGEFGTSDSQSVESNPPAPSENQ